MAHVTINLKAGKPSRQGFGIARYLTISTLGGSPTVDVDIEAKGFPKESLRNLRERDRIATPDAAFEAATFTAPVDCTIEVFASTMDLRLNNGEGMGVNAQITGPFPLSVQPTRGNAPGAPMYVSGVIESETPATAIVNHDPVAVTEAGAVVCAADPTRVELRLTNMGADAVALGAPGITWARRAVVLYPGDTLIETKGAALAWTAITDAGTTASVAMQELKA